MDTVGAFSSAQNAAAFDPVHVGDLIITNDSELAAAHLDQLTSIIAGNSQTGQLRISGTTAAVITAPLLTTIAGNLQITETNTALEEVLFDALTTLGGLSNYIRPTSVMTAVSFSSLVTTDRFPGIGYIDQAVTSLDIDSLAHLTAGGGGAICLVISNTKLTEILAPALATAPGTIQVYDNQLAETISFPALTSMGYTVFGQPAAGLLTIGGTLVEDVNLPLLTTAGFVFYYSEMTSFAPPSLTTLGAISFPTGGASEELLTMDFSLVINVIGPLNGQSRTPALQEIIFTSALKKATGNITFPGAAFTQAAVDSILVRLAALNGTGGTTSYNGKTVTLNGGTSSPPSATGLTAKATLEGRGCTVNVNS